MASSSWSHIKGKSNPADLPLCGTTFKELEESEVWFQDPLWLRGKDCEITEIDEPSLLECLKEMQVREKETLALSVTEKKKQGIGAICILRVQQL